MLAMILARQALVLYKNLRKFTKKLRLFPTFSDRQNLHLELKVV